MKKRTIKYTINKTLCGFTIASVLALTSCGKENVTDKNNSIEVADNLTENNEIQEEVVRITIKTNGMEISGFEEQLEDLRRDLPTMNYKIKELVIKGPANPYYRVTNSQKKLIEDIILSCPNLTSLSLVNLQLSSEDLSYVSNLINLTHLNLELNCVDDLSFLSELINLKSLLLCENSVVDISCLSNLTNLETLNVMSNEISDISVIKLLSSLNVFDVRFNNLDDYYEKLYGTREKIEELIDSLDNKSYRLEFLK